MGLGTLNAGDIIYPAYIYAAIYYGRPKVKILVPDGSPCFDGRLYFENPYNSSAGGKRKRKGEGVLEADYRIIGDIRRVHSGFHNLPIVHLTAAG